MIYNIFDLLLIRGYLLESVAVFLIKEVIHYKEVHLLCFF